MIANTCSNNVNSIIIKGRVMESTVEIRKKEKNDGQKKIPVKME